MFSFWGTTRKNFCSIRLLILCAVAWFFQTVFELIQKWSFFQFFLQKFRFSVLKDSTTKTFVLLWHMQKSQFIFLLSIGCRGKVSRRFRLLKSLESQACCVFRTLWKSWNSLFSHLGFNLFELRIASFGLFRLWVCRFPVWCQCCSVSFSRKIWGNRGTPEAFVNLQSRVLESLFLTKQLENL